MRIRRRPQAQALIPSDPSTAPPPPGDQHHWIPRYKGEEENNKSGEELHPYPNVDLGDEPSRPASPSPSPSRPQGHNVVGRSSENNAPGRGLGGAADGHHAHGSQENGHRNGRDQWTVIDAAGEGRLVNGVIVPAMPLAAALNVKDGIRSDGPPRRRRGPAVLLEGSRCSRVNGRGWRCSQPTLVGYSLCEHHLGKGRQSRSASANGGRSAGAPKLGRTEPAGGRKSAAAALAVVAVAALPDAAEPAARLTADQFGWSTGPWDRKVL